MSTNDIRTEIAIGDQVLRSTDIRHVVKHDRGVFTMKVLTPGERTWVLREVARRSGGNTLQPIEHGYIRMLVTLDVVVTEGPEWFAKYLGNVGECYDEALLADLYQQYNEFEDSFRSKLEQKQFKPTVEGPKVPA